MNRFAFSALMLSSAFLITGCASDNDRDDSSMTGHNRATAKHSSVSSTGTGGSASSGSDSNSNSSSTNSRGSTDSSYGGGGGSSMSGGGQSASLNSSDRSFVLEAASAGMFEVQSSKDVLNSAPDDSQIKDIAQMMIDDHTKANDELAAIAARKGVKLPSALMPKHQAMLDRAKGTTGTMSADQYRNMQIEAHKQAITLFENAAANCTDSDIRGFAANTLPTLRMHLSHLQSGTSGVGNPPASGLSGS